MERRSAHPLGTESQLTPSPDHTTRVQQLFVLHQSSVKAFVLSLLPNYTEAQDVLQEVFLTVTRKAGQFREGTNFTAWACSIARFKVLEFRRRHAAAAVMLSDDMIETLCGCMPEDAFDEDRLAAVHGCIEKLAPRAQQMIRLRYHAEHAPEEIARLLSWTPNAVNVALSKARTFLRACVQEEFRTGEPSWKTSA